ncbi:hypothetical protein LINGRAHAP2_LOCUS10398 [Linum grandiflorum]
MHHCVMQLRGLLVS